MMSAPGNTPELEYDYLFPGAKKGFDEIVPPATKIKIMYPFPQKDLLN